jgi:hypothetical protein
MKEGYPQQHSSSLAEEAMRDENLRVPLAPKNAELLEKLIRVAEKTGSTVVQVIPCQGSWSGTFEYTLSSTRGNIPEHLGC